MAKIETIFEDDVPSYEHMDALLTALHKTDKITASQYSAVKDSLRQFIPSRIVVQQRTPKSVTVFKAGEFQVRVTNRAHAYVEAVIL
jgi:hypothetical protein